MGTLPPTTHLGLVLPDPGTAQPFSTAVQNGWFQSIDTAVGADRARLTTIEDVTKPAAAGSNVGVVPSGTESERDAFWSIPGDAAARVALAAKAPRWYNTELGWEQQYYAQFDDAGATPKFAAATHGWKAKGRQLIHPGTIVAASGTAVDQGSHILFTGAAGVELRSLFTADFDDYEVVAHINGSSNQAMLWRMINGVTIETGATVYGRNEVQIDNGAVVGTYTTGNVGVLGEIGSSGSASPVKAVFYAPKLARVTAMLSESHQHTSGRQVRASGQVGNTTAYDGLWLSGTALSGEVQIFGIGR